MESSALNMAHEKIRRAEALSREGKFKEASDFHEQAVELFGQVHAKVINNLVDKRPKVQSIPAAITIDALELQREYHIRQANLARMQQTQIDEYRQFQKKFDGSMSKMSSARSQKEGGGISNGYLKGEIYKTIEEQDSLLNLMSLSVDKDTFKEPKDTATVIEELRTVNKHLRSLVGSLVGKLESKENEVRVLKERLQIFVPDSDIDERLTKSRSARLAPLPPLAPLGMPVFDFSTPTWNDSSREGESQQRNEEEEEEDVISS